MVGSLIGETESKSHEGSAQVAGVATTPQQHAPLYRSRPLRDLKRSTEFFTQVTALSALCELTLLDLRTCREWQLSGTRLQNSWSVANGNKGPFA